MDMITLRLPHKPRQLYVTIKKTIAATFQDAFLYPATQNMNTYVRWELFIIGCVFLGIPMYMDVHLHWLMLLPLMSIYLIHSAITGYEPIYDALKRSTNSCTDIGYNTIRHRRPDLPEHRFVTINAARSEED